MRRRAAAKKRRPTKIDLDQLYAWMVDDMHDAILRAMQKAQPPEAHVVN